MKKFPNVGGSLAYIVLLLTLSTIPQLVTIPTWAQAAPANPSAPTDTPIPVRNDEPNNNALWWLLLIPVGGLLWALLSLPRRKSNVEPSLTAPSVPSSPVNSVDPVLLDGRAPQCLPLDAVTVMGKSPQVVSDVPIAPVEPVTMEDRQSFAQIRLLEERLVVDLHKRKVGEVIVRKEIETRLVQVPIRREILIVEQVNPEFKQLAVVDLGQLPDAATTANDIELAPTVAASFTSPHAAIEFLKSISDRSSARSPELQMNIVLKDAEAQAFYREWREHHSPNND